MEENMQAYLTLEGHKLFANDATQVVRLMRNADFVPMDSDKEFMREYAKRAKLHNHDAAIETDSVQHFVDSLIRFGFLEKRPVRGQDNEQQG